MLQLPQPTDAFRVVNSDGDGLSGLVVDNYARCSEHRLHSLGISSGCQNGWRVSIAGWEPTGRSWTSIRKWTESKGSIPRLACDEVRSVRIQENDVRYEVDFTEGHKTGFFCDQRENRRRLTAWTQGRRVLDLCCYTGGFALASRVLGGAQEATGVDLDEKVIAQARRNSNLNQTRVDWVHCDAFAYARQMTKTGGGGTWWWWIRQN